VPLEDGGRVAATPRRVNAHRSRSDGVIALGNPIAAGPSVVDVVDAATGTSVFPSPASTGPTGALVALAVSSDGERVAGTASDRSL
jgi:hypothetical protein